MKIRNIPYKDLNAKEKQVVKGFWEENIKDGGSCYNHSECNHSIEEFWEIHREIDTNKGKYDGWVEPTDTLELIMEEKLKQIKNGNRSSSNR